MTQSRIRPLGGWPLVGCCFLAIAALVGLILISLGPGPQGLTVAIRATALTSLALFTSAFIASALHKIWPTPASQWIRSNRRYLGVSFAVSHFFHLAAIVALVRTTQRPLDPVTVAAGGLAYGFIVLMTATSFDRTAAWIGPRAWAVLHTTGVYVIWFVFVFSYVPRAFTSAAYVPLPVVLLAAFALRLVARRKRLNALGERVPPG